MTKSIKTVRNAKAVAVTLALLIPTTISAALQDKRMLDGKQWTTRNASVEVAESGCYDNDERHCRQYGRLYTWESARLACDALGPGWRLPSDDEWRQLARAYGGVSADSTDGGKAAYAALSIGGTSAFDAVLGGGREPDGRSFARLDAHGFYWTATTTAAGNAVFYNFGKGGLALHRQPEGEKKRAFSVRCVKD